MFVISDSRFVIKKFKFEGIEFKFEVCNITDL